MTKHQRLEERGRLVEWLSRQQVTRWLDGIGPLQRLGRDGITVTDIDLEPDFPFPNICAHLHAGTDIFILLRIAGARALL